MTKLAEERAQARVRSSSDIGLMIERTMSMANGNLDLLEQEYVEFRAQERGEPKNFAKRLTEIANLLDALTLSYARFKKAEREWSESMSPEEKLEAVTTFAVAMYKERPDYVAKWATGLLQALQAAGDSTKAIANRIDATPVPRKHMTMDDVLEAAGAQDDGWED
jgi:hypothetical protein